MGLLDSQALLDLLDSLDLQADLGHRVEQAAQGSLVPQDLQVGLEVLEELVGLGNQEGMEGLVELDGQDLVDLQDLLDSLEEMAVMVTLVRLVCQSRLMVVTSHLHHRAWVSSSFKPLK